MRTTLGEPRSTVDGRRGLEPVVLRARAVVGSDSGTIAFSYIEGNRLSTGRPSGTGIVTVTCEDVLEFDNPEVYAHRRPPTANR